jgi:hypothetical protein
MKKKSLVFLSVAFFSAFVPTTAEVQSNNQKSQAKNLFIIVMNGVRYDDAFGEKNHLYIDNIWSKLRPQGTICTKFDNRELTFPLPSQMSLLTGMWHVFKNPTNATIRPTVPTLFEYWNSARKDAGNTCYFASNNAAFEILTSSTHTEFGSKYAPFFDASTKEDINENAIYEKALPYIMEKKPSFVYLSLGSGVGKGVSEAELLAHECQEVGEKDACGGSELLNAYYESIILMDQIVYDLWDRIQKVETYKDNTVFLVLSNYGRHTDDFHGYGDKCRGCTQLYLLAIGPGIKKNFVSKQGRTLIDVCRTVGNLYNFPTQYAKGDVMKEIFE